MSFLELHERVKHVLEKEVAPALLMDGADLELVEVQGAEARVRLRGGCLSCPSTLMVLVTGLEQELRRHVPEIEYVEVVP